MVWLGPSKARGALTVASIGFAAWFLMRFYMDSANDSETVAYAAILFADVFRGAVAVDRTGHATLLAQYVLGLFAQVLQPLTGAYLLRAVVAAQLVIGLVLFAAAYVWYRRCGLAWLTSLIGLNLLLICIAFARQASGWELDKLLEPALYLLAAIAVVSRRYLLFGGLAILAALNRETGIFVPLLALSSAAVDRSALNWRVSASALLSIALVVVLRLAASHPVVAPATFLSRNLAPSELVDLLGGLCLIPLFALVSLPSAGPLLRRMTVLVTPLWLGWLVATDNLDQGARLLGLIALLFIPLALRRVEATLERDVRSPAVQGAR